MQTIKILIADDHGSFRSVLVSFLRSQPGIEVVGEAKDGDEAIDQSGRLQPDVVLLDVHMPKRSGVEATRAIKVLNPSIKVILMSTDSTEIYRRSAQLVADGYLPKSSIKETLSCILRAIPEQQSASVVVA